MSDEEIEKEAPAEEGEEASLRPTSHPSRRSLILTLALSLDLT